MDDREFVKTVWRKIEVRKELIGIRRARRFDFLKRFLLLVILGLICCCFKTLDIDFSFLLAFIVAALISGVCIENKLEVFREHYNS